MSILLVSLLGCGLVCAPISAAFHQGLLSARHPSHRVTLECPWRFFWMAFWRRLRVYKWLVGFIVAGSYLGVLAAAPRDIPLYYRCLYASLGPSILLAFGLLFIHQCWVWAPRCDTSSTLFLVATGMASAIYVVLYILSSIAVVSLGYRGYLLRKVQAIGMGSWQTEEGLDLLRFSLSLAPFVIVLLCVALCASRWREARRWDDDWFRFEQ
ncbi:hypothetical protein ACFL34_04815 [Candidatus Sumerlaeota bacterium]